MISEETAERDGFKVNGIHWKDRWNPICISVRISGDSITSLFNYILINVWLLRELSSPHYAQMAIVNNCKDAPAIIW